MEPIATVLPDSSGLHDRVKPERDHNNRPSRRRNWWLFGEPVGKLRKAWEGLSRVLLTPETARHRVFTFVDLPFCPDHKLYAICSEDALILGVLSSAVHRVWALAAGGRLGVGNDPTWTNTTCFEPYTFPAPSDAQAARIRTLAEDIDAHRKRQQAAHETLTLTGIYNVLEKLRSGEPLKPKERAIHEQGLVSILKQLHDELDLAILEAYGWEDLAPLMEVVNGNAALATAGVSDRDEAVRALDEALLERLVALNAARAAEERKGHVRWLRPAFQRPDSAPVAAQEEIDLGETRAVVPPTVRRRWPKNLTEQVVAVTEVLTAADAPLTEAELAAHFTARGPWRRRLGNILEMVVTLGRVRQEGSTYRAIVI